MIEYLARALVVTCTTPTPLTVPVTPSPAVTHRNTLLIFDFPHERVQQRTVEQTVDVLVPQIVEEIVKFVQEGLTPNCQTEP